MISGWSNDASHDPSGIMASSGISRSAPGYTMSSIQHSLSLLWWLSVSYSSVCQLCYFSFSSEMLPANLIQAQRDYFGAHTYELLSNPGTFVHTNWTGHGGNVSASTYSAWTSLRCSSLLNFCSLIKCNKYCCYWYYCSSNDTSVVVYSNAINIFFNVSCHICDTQ